MDGAPAGIVLQPVPAAAYRPPPSTRWRGQEDACPRQPVREWTPRAASRPRLEG